MSRLFLFGGLVCGCPSAALLGSCLRRIFVKQFAGAWRRGEFAAGKSRENRSPAPQPPRSRFIKV